MISKSFKYTHFHNTIAMINPNPIRGDEKSIETKEFIEEFLTQYTPTHNFINYITDLIVEAYECDRKSVTILVSRALSDWQSSKRIGIRDVFSLNPSVSRIYLRDFMLYLDRALGEFFMIKGMESSHVSDEIYSKIMYAYPYFLTSP